VYDRRGRGCSIRRAPHASTSTSTSTIGDGVSAIDLPPGSGLLGTPLGTFTAPQGARRLAKITLGIVLVTTALTWALVARHPWRHDSSTLVVLPVAFGAFATLGFLVRRARVLVTRDGVRWGWAQLGFHQPASRIKVAHIYSDGVALEARRGSWWFIAARDWDRFDALVRQLRRAELPVETHAGTAPIRARLQSYGRFLDGLLIVSMLGAVLVALAAV